MRATLENPAQLERALRRAGQIPRTLTEAQLPGLTTAGLVASRPFGASGVYIRVRGAAGATPKTFAATSGSRASQAGRYVADVTVPAESQRSRSASRALGTLTGQAPTRADMHLPDRQRPVRCHQGPGHRDQLRRRRERTVDPTRRGTSRARRAAGRVSHPARTAHRVDHWPIAHHQYAREPSANCGARRPQGDTAPRVRRV